jgi:two-component system chemotaxis response regulator CheB
MPIPERLRFDVKVAKGEGSSIEELEGIGRRSVLSCPECGGVMWEIEEGDLIRYRCHVGHALSSQAMSAGITDKVREALYVALRALDEQAALSDKLLTRASAQGRNRMAEVWARKKEETNRQRDVIQKTINQADEIAFESITQSETTD